MRKVNSDKNDHHSKSAIKCIAVGRMHGVCTITSHKSVTLMNINVYFKSLIHILGCIDWFFAIRSMDRTGHRMKRLRYNLFAKNKILIRCHITDERIEIDIFVTIHRKINSVSILNRIMRYWKNNTVHWQYSWLFTEVATLYIIILTAVNAATLKEVRLTKERSKIERLKKLSEMCRTKATDIRQNEVDLHWKKEKKMLRSTSTFLICLNYKICSHCLCAVVFLSRLFPSDFFFRSRSNCCSYFLLDWWCLLVGTRLRAHVISHGFKQRVHLTKHKSNTRTKWRKKTSAAHTMHFNAAIIKEIGCLIAICLNRSNVKMVRVCQCFAIGLNGHLVFLADLRTEK